MQRIHKSGFLQFRDAGDKWRFYVTGFDATFTGQDGFCNVLHADLNPSTRRVSIDKRDRILIDGRRYSSKHWMH